MLALKFLCTQHINFVLYKLPTSLMLFFNFVLSGKNGKSLCSVCNCLGYLASTFKKSLYHLDVFATISKLSTDSPCDIVHPYKLLTSQYIRYDDSLLRLQSFCLLLAPAY